jgi:hypothetical protein
MNYATIVNDALASPTREVPSRYDNPFATCWTRPGAIAYRFVGGQNAELLIGQLRALGWRGAIIGPHGSGKSTLLETLKPALRDAGRRVHTVALRYGQRSLPRDFLASIGAASDSLVIVDGYEQLSWVEKWRLGRRCRRANAGLLVTSHSPTRLPTLIRLAPDLPLVEQLVADLAARVSTPVTREDIAASLACHGSNVREVFFDLYDLHERSRVCGRTQVASAT